ncbi:hypothetical protein ILYODFUR_024188 [Ilyodon furcidens]|uniref:Uncharacterized protein n=1 Tax=Ilyodon furcidens TaxID=33524 RepID=A0ABV0TYJ2_9TELE
MVKLNGERYYTNSMYYKAQRELEEEEERAWWEKEERRKKEGRSKYKSECEGDRQQEREKRDRNRFLWCKGLNLASIGMILTKNTYFMAAGAVLGFFVEDCELIKHF